jgi:hypothetical protein
MYIKVSCLSDYQCSSGIGMMNFRILERGSRALRALGEKSSVSQIGLVGKNFEVAESADLFGTETNRLRQLYLYLDSSRSVQPRSLASFLPIRLQTLKVNK